MLINYKSIELFNGFQMFSLSEISASVYGKLRFFTAVSAGEEPAIRPQETEAGCGESYRRHRHSPRGKGSHTLDHC